MTISFPTLSAIGIESTKETTSKKFSEPNIELNLTSVVILSPINYFNNTKGKLLKQLK
jgi:hypothetical protein